MPVPDWADPWRYRRVVASGSTGRVLVLYNARRFVVYHYYRSGYLARVEVVTHTIPTWRRLHCAARRYPDLEQQYMKRKDIQPVAADRHATMDGLDHVPEWGDWMTAASWDDGTLRAAPSTTFFCTAGEWRVCLRDKAERLVLWLSAPTFQELVSLIEDMVQNATAPWRRDEFDGGDGKRVKRPKS